MGHRVVKTMLNVQLRSSRENLHLMSAEPGQILQASSRAKRQSFKFFAPFPSPR